LLGEVVIAEQIKVTQEIEKFMIDASAVESGVYYVVAESTGSREVRKIVILNDN
jgi:hypothetical protein